MLRKITATLGVGAAVTGLTPVAHAGQMALSQPESPAETLQGESVREQENIYNSKKDYPTILAQAEPILLRNSSPAEIVTPIPAEILELIRKVEISTGASSLDSDQLVRVQIHLN